jgi:hypothetical protein
VRQIRASVVIRCVIGSEEARSARRQPRRPNRATGAEIMRWVAIALASIVTSGLTATAAADSPGDGYTVFRQYGAHGGLKDEFERLAARNPRITKLVTIGETHRGQDIVALKVSRHAGQTRDGRRPAVLYVGAQHAPSGYPRRWSAGSRAA